MRLIAVRPLIPIRIWFLPRLNRHLSISMASQNKDGNIEIKKLDVNSSVVSKTEIVGKKGTIKPPLEPPEKPLPGDCCGSGCVRCVWDVYYEELEAYNKSLALLSASDSDDSKTNNV